jgi:hypothetical protein
MHHQSVRYKMLGISGFASFFLLNGCEDTKIKTKYRAFQQKFLSRKRENLFFCCILLED